MNLRQYYAARAMQGMLAGLDRVDVKKLAELSFMIADEMMIAGADRDGLEEIIELVDQGE